MSAALEDYHKALKATELASLGPLANELNLDDESASVTALKASEDSLALAARDLTRAVDALPMERRPKRWNA
jgi:hypothetical protein